MLVTTDLGPGTVTTSGYPRTARLWRRGTPLEQAEEIFSCEADDLAVDAWHDHTPGFARELVQRAIDFFSAELYLRRPDGELVLVDVPRSAETAVHREWLVVQLREDWVPVPDGWRHPAGSLLAAPLEDWIAGSRELTVLFVPTPSTSLAGLTWTRHHLVLTVLDDVRTRVVVLTPPDRAAVVPSWETSTLPGLPELSTVTVGSVDRVASDAVWLVTTGFTTPTTLSVQEVGSGDPPDALKQAPAFFDAEGVLVAQHFAISDDGTRVPYFLVRGRGARTDGQAPTLLYGYGGFEISLLPSYSGTLGRAWLSQGGVYALANIRGGGEYGPGWHQAALRDGRHRAYQDFAAVARDLVQHGRHHAGPPRGAGRVERRAADRQRAHAVPRPGGRRGDPGTAARHAPLLPPAGRRLVDGRVRGPGRPRRLGVPAHATRPTICWTPTGTTRPCCSPPPRATTACTPVTPGRSRPGCATTART